jgi:hypothetical protein
MGMEINTSDFESHYPGPNNYNSYVTPKTQCSRTCDVASGGYVSKCSKNIIRLEFVPLYIRPLKEIDERPPARWRTISQDMLLVWNFLGDGLVRGVQFCGNIEALIWHWLFWERDFV